MKMQGKYLNDEVYMLYQDSKQVTWITKFTYSTPLVSICSDGISRGVYILASGLSAQELFILHHGYCLGGWVVGGGGGI